MPLKLLSANHAAAIAALMAGTANRGGRGFCSGVYPITPSTECMEYVCEHPIEKGEVVLVEAEHSAMGVCMGASASGARTFTATAANGLIHMAENVVSAALLRLPIVMKVANRSVGPPWNIWCDHGDSLLLRDSGWMQFYSADNQEHFDTVLSAYRLAEDERVLLPAMACADGFLLSHTTAQIEIPEQSQVDAFLPTLNLAHRLGLDPRLMGAISPPRQSEVHRRQMHEAMDRALGVYREIQGEFEAIFKRKLPDPLVGCNLDTSETLIISMGTIGSTVEAAIASPALGDKNLGSLRVRMLRPFPYSDLKTALKGKKRVAVIDRDLSYGFGGVLWGEIRGYAEPGAIVQNYITGLGGGDVRQNHIVEIVEDLTSRSSSGQPVFVEVG